jgi:hypothetical protein
MLKSENEAKMANFHESSLVIKPRFLLSFLKLTGLFHALSQSLDHLRTQEKCSFRQTQKNIFKIDQACPNALGLPQRPRTAPTP